MANSSIIAHAHSLSQRACVALNENGAVKSKHECDVLYAQPHTNAHTVRGRPTLKDVERFRNIYE